MNVRINQDLLSITLYYVQLNFENVKYNLASWNELPLLDDLWVTISEENDTRKNYSIGSARITIVKKTPFFKSQ